jgi:predicted DNA-binding WGR domain protein
MKRTFIYQDENSQKFWSIETKGTNFTVNFGKLGTSGQTSEKSFTAKDECQKAADKLIAEKVKKGYKETADKLIAEKVKKGNKKTADNTDTAKLSAKLKFKSFNFKLIIINELMYKQEWLQPKFDVWEFAEKNGIDIEEDGYDPIPKVVKYFKNLEIDEKFANEVKEIELLGGDKIYGQIWPFWDGECDYFDVTKLTAEEVKQFPNLRITVAEAMLTDESIEVLDACGAFADNARGMLVPQSANGIRKDKKDEVPSKIKNVIENGFEIKQNGIIVSYSGDEKDLIIPPVIGGIKVLKIGGEGHVGVLANKGLTSVVISEGITYIGGDAFKENKLVKVVFPKSLKTIGNGSFFNNNLTEIVIPENIDDKIALSVFKGNPLKVITVSRGGMFLWIRPDFYKCYKENGMKAGTYILDGEKWKLKE